MFKKNYSSTLFKVALKLWVSDLWLLIMGKFSFNSRLPNLFNGSQTTPSLYNYDK